MKQSKGKTNPQQAFKIAVINEDWAQADEAYKLIPRGKLADTMVFTMLHLIERHHMAQLRVLLQEYPAAKDAVNRVVKSQFVLGKAFHYANRAAVDLLLQYGANPFLSRTFVDKDTGKELTHTILDCAKWTHVRSLVAFAEQLLAAPPPAKEAASPQQNANGAAHP